MASATLALDSLADSVSTEQSAVDYMFPAADAQSVEVTRSIDAASWLVSALNALKKLTSLRPNWDSYSGLIISTESLANARLLLSSIRADQIPGPFIAPISNGGVALEWTQAPRDLEIELLPDGSVEILTANGDNIREIRISTPEDVPINRLVEWVFSD
jgi:hypothetical protein